MNGIEAIKAMMEGKTVEVTLGFATVEANVRYRFNDGLLVMVELGKNSGVKMNDFLLSQFEVVPEYPLTFFEAMEAINEGKKVTSEVYNNLNYQKDEDGRIFYLNYKDKPEYVGFSLEEVEAKWKIVEE